MALEEKIKYPHIVFDEKGVPTLQGTTLKVIELVVEKLAYGWSPEELYFQHPYLSLGQIHGALAYYWDHVEELNEEIAEQLKKVEELRKQAKIGQSALAARLKTKGLF